MLKATGWIDFNLGCDEQGITSIATESKVLFDIHPVNPDGSKWQDEVIGVE